MTFARLPTIEDPRWPIAAASCHDAGTAIARRLLTERE